MLRALLDICFPPVCLLCSGRSSDRGLCRGCASHIEKRRITGPRCSVCGAPFTSTTGVAHECGRCHADRPAFKSAISAFAYDGPVLDAVHKLKYYGDVSLAAPLARAAMASLSDAGPFVVVPVPLYPRRLKERGFNQSVLIARELSRLTGHPLELRRLLRSRDTGQQVGRSARERQRNVAGAFALRDGGAFRGKRVLLIDDVATTGATLNECAKVLRGAGAEVFALTVARATRT